MTETRTYSLDSPLPAPAVARGLQGIFGYRRFPVFSGPWLGRRALVFVFPIGALALLTLMGSWASSGEPSVGLAAGGLLFLSFMLMSFAGPTLACWVRYRRWPLGRERLAVVAAVLLGMAMSFVVDRETSARLEPLVERKLSPPAGVDAGQLERARQFERSPWGIAINFAFLGATYLLLGGGLALRGYFSEQRRVLESARQAELAGARLAAQQSALRLSLLQAQIAPHFLFNTLASVRALVSKDPSRAERTLDALADHLRACMPRLDADGQVGVSTVGREVEACRSYLELMRLRLGDRLAYSIEVDAARADQPMLPMLLLTLVENAVKHGIEPLRGPGWIALRCEREADAQLWVVEDSGAGLKPGVGSGVGLANLRGQLRDRYGAAAQLELRARVEGGVRACIRLPLEEPA